MIDTAQTLPASQKPSANRWVILVLGIICMASVANLQYGWTLFVLPISHKNHWSRADIQVAFSIFILFETWLVPFEGWIVDHIGPRWLILLGGICVILSWVVFDAHASTLWMLYVGGALGGLGAGAVYGTCVANALKWFPDKRGLCAGLTAAGYGAGAAITVAPIRSMIHSSGYEHTFLVFGIVYGVIIIIVSNFIKPPDVTSMRDMPSMAKIRTAQNTGPDVPPGKMLQSPIFWCMYVMFVLVAAGGLMSAAQLAPIAHERHLASVMVLGFPAIVVALECHSITNGVGRPLNGWFSDMIGRANMMAISFGILAVCIAAFGLFGTTPALFIITDALVFLFWGDIFSLFAATVGDAFGRKYATVNYGLLYTAKGVASLLVPIGSVVTAATGSWHLVYYIGAVMAFICSMLGLFVLNPLIKSRLTMVNKLDAVAPANPGAPAQ
ncbi:MAG TPA: oxalate/formate MFS antiporter [Acidiphilium sp.]